MPAAYDNEHTVNQAVMLMATLSPRARDSVDLELYRESADSDGSTPQYILEYVFVEFTKDLEDLGLQFDIDYSEYCSNLGTLFSFLRLGTVLLPNNLYALVKSNMRLRDTINAILDGNMDPTESVIHNYLSAIAGLEINNPIFPELTEFVDSIYHSVSQTDKFTTYLENVRELSQDEMVMAPSSQEDHLSYSDKIKLILTRLGQSISDYSETPDVYKTYRFIQNDLLAPANFHHYAYLFLQSKDSLPDDVGELFDRRWYEHYVSHRWFPEYHILRKTRPSQSDIICMLGMTYALSPTREDFDKRVTQLITVGVSRDLLSKFQSQY